MRHLRALRCESLDSPCSRRFDDISSAQLAAKVAYTAARPLAKERAQRRPVDVAHVSGHGFEIHAAAEKRLGMLHA